MIKFKNINMIIGHQKILDYLKKSATKDRVSHGYLFYGPEKIGKRKVAFEFAKILQCRESPHQSKHGTGQVQFSCGVCKSCQDIETERHPDVAIIRADLDSREIEISQIRNLRKNLSLSSHSGNYKIAIIDDAHNLNVEAANALLKTLEEPRGRTVLILASAFPGLLPKTIISRLQQIRFSFVSGSVMEEYLEQAGIDENQREELLRISYGRPGILQDILADLKKKDNYKSFMRGLAELANFDFNERFEYVKKISENRQDSIRFLEGLLIFFRDIFLIKLGVDNFIINNFFGKDLAKIAENYSRNRLYKILKLTRRLTEMISRSNVNPRLCLEVLMLEI